MEKNAMKKVILVIAVILLSAVLWGSPAGKQHKDITIMAGIITYDDGFNDYGIVAISKNENGEVVIQQLNYSRTVDIELLAKTLKNQAGMTAKQIKENGYAIDQKRRMVKVSNDVYNFIPSFGSSFKWQFSQKLTDAIVLVIPEPEYIEPTSLPKDSQKIAKANKTEKQLKTKLELLKENRKQLKELLK